MRHHQISIHENELPQACPYCHLLLGLERILLRQHVLEKLEDVVLVGHKCVPCNASKLSLDSKGNLGELVGRATTGKTRGFPNPEEAVHGVDFGHEVVLR